MNTFPPRQFIKSRTRADDAAGKVEYISMEEHEHIVKQAKAAAYNDAAKCVATGFSFASIYGVIAKKAAEALK